MRTQPPPGATRLLLGQPWRLEGAEDRAVATVAVEVVGWRFVVVERTGDEALNAIATPQAGQATTAQCRAAGLSRQGIKTRLRSGRLHRTQYVGVLRIGHEAKPPFADEVAALLVAPRLSAVGFASLLPLARLGRGDGAGVHVVTTSAVNRQRRGIVLHRTCSLDENEVTGRYGVPTTTVMRALWDLAGAGMRGKALDRLIGDAIADGHVSEQELGRSFEKNAGRAGAPALRGIVDLGVVPADSRVELKLARGLQRAGAPSFEMHGHFAGFRPDILFRDLGVGVEVKGKHHRLASRFESDHDREMALRDAGLTLLPFTARKVDRELDAVVGRVMLEVGSAQATRRRHTA